MARIALIGPGAIGCAIAAALIEAGHDVVIGARQGFDRLSVRKAGEAARLYPVTVVTDPAALPPADWVVLCVKAYQVASAADWLVAAPRLAVFQNGIEQRENVAPFVPAATPIVPVIVDLPARRSAPGEVVWQRIATVAVPPGPEGEAFAGLFAGSFVSAEATDAFLTRAWMKLCNNAPSGAILALSGRRMAVFQRPDIAALARAILQECVAVGRAEGAMLDDGLVERQMAAFLAAGGEEGNSMYEDRMAGREMEWNARNAVILRKAARHGLAVPVSAALVPLLAAISDAAKP